MGPKMMARLGGEFLAEDEMGVGVVPDPELPEPETEFEFEFEPGKRSVGTLRGVGKDVKAPDEEGVWGAWESGAFGSTSEV